MEPFIDEKPVTFVPGGETRQASVWEGLSAVEATYDGLVAVHDGARPCADGELIERVVTAAAEHKAAIAAVPVVETLKALADENTIKGTVDRGAFCRAQTPQCFQHELLRRAFERARSDGFEGTDEAALVERLDVAVRLVVGSESNIKVTTPEDFARVEYLLELGRA
jgi:2-C-methyl-D-erythritol 4-phosphate cytidylyltransferase